MVMCLLRLMPTLLLWGAVAGFAPSGISTLFHRHAGVTVSYEPRAQSAAVPLDEKLEGAGLPLSGRNDERAALHRVPAPSMQFSSDDDYDQGGRSRDRPTFNSGGGYRERGDRFSSFDSYAGSRGGDRGYGMERSDDGGYGRARYGGRGRGRGRGGFGSRGSRQRMPGDWRCRQCGAHCFASRDTCFRCNAERPGSEASTKWQGIDGTEDFEANRESDEAAFREQFGCVGFPRIALPPSSHVRPSSHVPPRTWLPRAASHVPPRRPKPDLGIDFSKYAEIPVEVELPRSMDELPAAMQPVEQFADLDCGKVLQRNLAFAGFAAPTPVQVRAICRG